MHRAKKKLFATCRAKAASTSTVAPIGLSKHLEKAHLGEALLKRLLVHDCRNPGLPALLIQQTNKMARSLTNRYVNQTLVTKFELCCDQIYWNLLFLASV